MGLRSKLSGYQYSEIVCKFTMVYFCGGDHFEDISKLAGDLRLSPDARIPSSDTIARGLKELAEDTSSIPPAVARSMLIMVKMDGVRFPFPL